MCTYSQLWGLCVCMVGFGACVYVWSALGPVCTYGQLWGLCVRMVSFGACVYIQSALGPVCTYSQLWGLCVHTVSFGACVYIQSALGPVCTYSQLWGLCVHMYVYRLYFPKFCGTLFLQILRMGLDLQNFIHDFGLPRLITYTHSQEYKCKNSTFK